MPCSRAARNRTVDGVGSGEDGGLMPYARGLMDGESWFVMPCSRAARNRTGGLFCVLLLGAWGECHAVFLFEVCGVDVVVVE